MKRNIKTDTGTNKKAKMKRFISKLKMITLALMIFVTSYFIVMIIVEYFKSKF